MFSSSSPEIERLEKEVAEAKKRLAEARRNLPARPVQDYLFSTSAGLMTRLSDLFGKSRDLIVIHNMGRKCVYCTLWADGLNGLRRPLADRAGFVVSSPDSPDVQREFAASRDWRFPMISTLGTTFARDMGFESPKAEPWPGVSAFRREENGTIIRTGAASFGPGDDFCALWPLLELLKDGVGGWEPKYEY